MKSKRVFAIRLPDGSVQLRIGHKAPVETVTKAEESLVIPGRKRPVKFKFETSYWTGGRSIGIISGYKFDRILWYYGRYDHGEWRYMELTGTLAARLLDPKERKILLDRFR